MLRAAISLACTTSLLACGTAERPDNEPTPVSTLSGTPVSIHGELSVQGNQVLDYRGEVFSVAGPSLFWGNKGWIEKTSYSPDTYYNASVVAYFRREWNAPVIRIAMGSESRGGYIEDPDGRWQKISAVADAAIAEGMYFIVDWHSHRAEQHPEEAADFFEQVARTWGETPNLIYEIYNEPLDTTDWASTVKPYSEQVIAAIRDIDPDNLILVGSQSWSQDVDKVADNPVIGFSNIAYTLHFYAGTHKKDLRDKAQYALDNGIALFVSEWGTVNANGDGGADAEETERWMEFLKDRQLSHLNWSVHSKAEGASMLRPGTDPDATTWTEATFTESGRLVRSIITTWHQHDYTGR